MLGMFKGHGMKEQYPSLCFHSGTGTSFLLAAPFPCVYASDPREVLVGLGGRRAAALCSVRKLYSY